MPLELTPRGGGGTDFRPAFHWVEEHGIAPAALIYLTDLECTHFPDEPGYPVLWARIGQCHAEPLFGQLIDIRDG